MRCITRLVIFDFGHRKSMFNKVKRKKGFAYTNKRTKKIPRFPIISHSSILKYSKLIRFFKIENFTWIQLIERNRIRVSIYVGKKK